MKRSTILVIAVIALLAAASAAYAGTSSTYAVWTSAAPNNNPANPHGGYALNTNKCAVCHSAHKAALLGEVLLPSSVADACVYCHIYTNIGGIVLYNGDSTKYTSEAPTVAQSFGGGFAHNSPYVTCTDCHSVHGAMTLAGGNAPKILKDWTYWRDTPGGFSDYFYLAQNKWPVPRIVAMKYAQTTAWCTGCHKYFIESYDESATAVPQQTRILLGGTPTWVIGEPAMCGSHVCTVGTYVPGGYYGNPAASIPATQVAFYSSEFCRSCHDRGDVDSAPGVVLNSFPHYTPDYYRFIGVGPNAGTTGAVNTTGTVDGMCLKCHVDSTGTQGVGLTF